MTTSPVLRFREIAPPAVRWRDIDDRTAEALFRAPETSLAAIVGPPGVQGPAGSGSSGFGSIDYRDGDAGTQLALPAGQWVRVARALTASPANFDLPKGQFAGFDFYSGGLLHARAKGDVYLFKFAYRITPSFNNATLRFAVRPGGNPAFDFGPSPIAVGTNAGTEDTGSVTFTEQARTRFVTQGAEVHAMLSSGGWLTEFSPEIMPLSAGA